MTLLLHVSDTHFGTEQPDVVEALLALAREQRPDLVVLSGDITQRARKSQFAAAQRFVRALGAPVLAVPGNHDIALFNLFARFLRPYAAYAHAFGSDLAPVFETDDVLVLGVNTTRRWRHKNGEVSAQQVADVSRRLQQAGEQQLRVVVVHQPVAVPHAEEAHNLLRGHHAALKAWALAGADLVLGGHIHLPYVMAVPGLGRELWAVQAGTAVSSRTRKGGPNSVNLLRWGAGAPAGDCVVERWDYGSAGRCFACVQATGLLPLRQTMQRTGG